MKPPRPEQSKTIQGLIGGTLVEANKFLETHRARHRQAAWAFLGASAFGGIAVGQASGSTLAGVATGIALEAASIGVQNLNTSRYAGEQVAAMVVSIGVEQAIDIALTKTQEDLELADATPPGSEELSANP